ncbi:hypothetical protein SAMN05660206_101424 [Sphingobacterium wenxiniae]|uniref:Uncharacterized protein n=1 Tax=Sphingobacterium wenxiniae TaxID=683125 RepID=A0A1I6PEN7_9SPHI|nr:hypothetical protein SAMN05660206_101424 [Sphingobacterium wenxiniae]
MSVASYKLIYYPYKLHLVNRSKGFYEVLKEGCLKSTINCHLEASKGSERQLGDFLFHNVQRVITY